MIGDPDGFGRGDPNKHMERQFDFHKFIAPKIPQPIFGPFSPVNGDVSEKRGLSAFSTYLAQKHGDFDILGFKVKEKGESIFWPKFFCLCFGLLSWFRAWIGCNWSLEKSKNI